MRRLSKVHKEKLKIGICHTKSGPDAISVYKSFEQGLTKHGDTCEHILGTRELTRSNADLFLMISYPHFDPRSRPVCEEYPIWRPAQYNSGTDNNLRKLIVDTCKQSNRRVLIVDSGMMKMKRDRSGDSLNYYQVGYDNIKGLGKYYNENSPEDRWKLLGLELKDWKEQEIYRRVLIYGQVRFGIGSQHVDIEKFYKHVFSYLKTANRKIFYLEHPNVHRPFIHSKYNIHYVNFAEKFNHIDCAVGFSTNASIESLLAGVPTIVMSQLSPAYKFCSNNIEDLKRPKTFDRQQFFYDLAYTQWQPLEMASGSAWEFLKPHAMKDYEGL